MRGYTLAERLSAAQGLCFMELVTEDLGIDWRIVLKWILRGSRVGSCWLDSSGSGWGPVVGFCEHGNEHTVYVRGGEFIE